MKPEQGAITICGAIGGGSEHWQWFDRRACKNLVKRRWRQTGACWKVPRANRIAVICATLYSDQCDDCRKNYH